MPGHDPGGIIATILIGIASSFVGTFVGRAIALYRQGEPGRARVPASSCGTVSVHKLVATSAAASLGRADVEAVAAR